MHWDIDHDSPGILLTKESRERTAMKKTRKVKEMRAKVSSHLSVGTITLQLQLLSRCPENSTPQDGKETKTADPPAENLSVLKAEQGQAE